jgi:hypothetical protein
MDCLLEVTQEAVLAENATRHKAGINPIPFPAQSEKQVLEYLADGHEDPRG